MSVRKIDSRGDVIHDDNILSARKRLKPLTLMELEDLPPSKFLIKGLLGAGEMSVWYGEPGCTKSFLLLDLSRIIATLKPWFGRRTNGGPVLYVMAEGGNGAQKRIKAIKKTHGLKDDATIFFTTVAPDLLSDDDKEAIIYWTCVHEAVLVVMDTLSRTMNGDDNSSTDMPAYVRACDDIREATAAHIAIIHHCGKDKSKGSRGHSSLYGATDAEVFVEKQNNGNTATITKNKDGEDGWHVGYKLRAIDVGIDEDGEPITSCAVFPADVSLKSKQKQIRGHASTLLNSLHELLIKIGETVRGREGIPDGAVCVSLNSVRTEFYRRLPDSCDEKEKAQAAKQKAFTRALDTLENRIGYKDNLVWDIEQVSGQDRT